MWYFFLWIWLFSKCNPAIFVTLHWKRCFHLCMDDVYYFLFPPPYFKRKKHWKKCPTKPIITNQTNQFQPADRLDRHQPDDRQPRLLYCQGGEWGFESLPNLTTNGNAKVAVASEYTFWFKIQIEPILIFATNIAFSYSLSCFVDFFIIILSCQISIKSK